MGRGRRSATRERGPPTIPAVPDLRVGIAIALVLLLPGVLILLAARVRLTVVEWLVIAPACSLGAVYVLAEFLTLAGVPFGPAAFLAMVAVLGVAATLRIRRGGWCRPVLDRHGDTPQPSRAVRRLQRPGVLVALGLLGVAIAVGAATWSVSTRDEAVIAPGSDAVVHGFMIGRVAETESIRPDDIFDFELSGGKDPAGVDYYPLALHSSVAVGHRTTGAPIGALLNGIILFFTAFVFPLGLFALARHLIPDEPLAAGFAALIGSLISMFPYQPIWWGLIPLTMGVVLIPITVVLLVRTVGDGWSRSGAVVTGLVVAGGFALHNSQLPLILALAALVLLFRDGASAQVRWRDACTRLAWIGVVAAVLLAPTLPQIVAGGGERASQHPPTMALSDFLPELFTLSVPFTDPQTWLIVLAGAGIVLLLWRRQLWGWILGAVVVVGLVVAAATTDDPITRTLTFAWYRDAFRINYNLAIFVAIFGGVLLGITSRWIARYFSPRAWALPVVAVLVVASLFPVGAAEALRTNRDRISTWYDLEAPVHTEEVRAFEFMREHARPGEAVLNDAGIDGAGWMYPLAGLNPVFSVLPGTTRSWYERLYLRDHIGQLGDDARADALVRRFRVRFVYYTERSMPMIGRHVFTLSGLRSAPHLTEVYKRGGVHVFAVDPSPLQTETTRDAASLSRQ
jgi:Family of unknown function (DUF6541)